MTRCILEGVVAVRETRVDEGAAEWRLAVNERYWWRRKKEGGPNSSESAWTFSCVSWSVCFLLEMKWIL